MLGILKNEKFRNVIVIRTKVVDFTGKKLIVWPHEFGERLLAKLLYGRRAVRFEASEMVLMPYFKHRPQSAVWHSLARF